MIFKPGRPRTKSSSRKSGTLSGTLPEPRFRASESLSRLNTACPVSGPVVSPMNTGSCTKSSTILCTSFPVSTTTNRHPARATSPAWGSGRGYLGCPPGVLGTRRPPGKLPIMRTIRTSPFLTTRASPGAHRHISRIAVLSGSPRPSCPCRRSRIPAGPGHTTHVLGETETTSLSPSPHSTPLPPRGGASLRAGSHRDVMHHDRTIAI